MKLYLEFCCAYMLLLFLFSTHGRVYAQYDSGPVFKGVQGKTRETASSVVTEKLKAAEGALNIA